LTTPEEISKAAWFFLGGGVVILGIGALLLTIARSADARNWVLARAPLLRIGLLNPRDDAWVRGEMRCDEPLTVPHFGEACVAYDYLQEQKVTESETDSKGRSRTKTTWVARDSRAEAVDFEITEDEDSIRLHADEAELRDLEQLGHDYEFGRTIRHSARVLRYPGVVSALGCVGEHGAWLEKHANIPLIVTPRTRAEMLASAERGETALRVTGHVLILIGLWLALYAAGLHLDLPRAAVGKWSSPSAILAGIVSMTLFVSATMLYVFNTMATYRMRTRNAWHQIGVDAKNRFDLVPRLVEIAKGAAKHEKETLERLTRLRAGTEDRAAAIDQEARVSSDVARLVALKEAYPELGSQPVFARLHRELIALEEKIAHDRTFYDDCATEFNSLIGQVPHRWLAGLCGFSEEPLFQAAAVDRRAPGFS